MNQLTVSKGGAQDILPPAVGIVASAPTAPRPKFFLIGENERFQRPMHGTAAAVARSGKFVCINGNWQALRGRTISFKQIINFALPTQDPGSAWNFTVTYRHGPRLRPSGLLQPGDALPLVEGILINVSVAAAS